MTKCKPRISHDKDVALAKVNALSRAWARYRNELLYDDFSQPNDMKDFPAAYAFRCLLDTLVDEVPEGDEND